MEASALKEVIEKGFKNLRVELDEKFGKIDNHFSKLGKEVQKAADDAHLAHVAIENLRHDFGIFDEGESSPLETRVSALEVRVTKLERKRSPKKKSGTAAE